jgi:hypothetical protein
LFSLSSPENTAWPRRSGCQFSALSVFSTAKTKKTNHRERKGRKERTTAKALSINREWKPMHSNHGVNALMASDSRLFAFIRGFRLNNHIALAFIEHRTPNR